jgi:hypothetical protein
VYCQSSLLLLQSNSDLDQKNKFCSRLLNKRCGEQGDNTGICNKENHG